MCSCVLLYRLSDLQTENSEKNITYKMEVIIANVDNYKFDIEIALDEQYGALPLPFPGMDS